MHVLVLLLTSIISLISGHPSLISNAQNTPVTNIGTAAVDARPTEVQAEDPSGQLCQGTSDQVSTIIGCE